MSEPVGFIGLGIMGQGMARNLLKAQGNCIWSIGPACDNLEGSLARIEFLEISRKRLNLAIQAEH